jgi:nucleoside 2-deoxyribosyltransferase
MTPHSTSATDGLADGHTPTPLSPVAFAQACRAAAELGGDRAHHALDRLVTEHLHNLGFSEGMEVFMENVTAAHKSLYLCGPINGCTDEECKDWRSYVTEAWQGRCIDPMVRDYRGREAEAYREIVELDKIDVAEADIILVNYDKPSVGTSMEILYAWERGKRIIVVCREDAVISPWLRYHSTHLAHSFDDALAIARTA